MLSIVIQQCIFILPLQRPVAVPRATPHAYGVVEAKRVLLVTWWTLPLVTCHHGNWEKAAEKCP